LNKGKIMEKVNWNKLVYQHGHFQHLVSEFMKNRPLNGAKIKIISNWIDDLKALIMKECGK